MKVKSNKGITMISLIIVIIIMIMLASITAYEANDLIKKAEVQSVTTNLLLIQAKVRIINEKVVFESDDAEKAKLLIGSKLSENTNILNSLKNKGLIQETENADDYYVLSKDDLINMGLDSIEAIDNEYVVNYTSEEVIYVNGIKKSDGNYLYKVSEINV